MILFPSLLVKLVNLLLRSFKGTCIVKLLSLQDLLYAI